ncbi:MAG: alpha/beta hydrolase [Massilia sp.]|nr:alpha/beta hydrolase [Massilia sp.]
MPTTTANGITIAYETAGDPKATPVLLVMGLGMQLTAWPDDFVDGLVDLGYYVIRFDNRDCGLSTKLTGAGAPNLKLALLKSVLRLPLRPAYSLADMAGDALAVMNALGVARAHVVGMSMGGMIAQIMAARHPQRVASLTSMMSSSGRRGLPGPTRAARAALLRPLPKARAGARAGAAARLAEQVRLVDHLVGVLRTIGSPAYPSPERPLRERLLAAVARNVCPHGVARQLMATIADGSRAALLAQIACPTLVIHGAADPLVPLACGVDTAKLVPGARLEIIEGMGHDLPGQLIERLLALIDTHARGKMAPDSLPRLFEKQ